MQLNEIENHRLSRLKIKYNLRETCENHIMSMCKQWYIYTIPVYDLHACKWLIRHLIILILFENIPSSLYLSLDFAYSNFILSLSHTDFNSWNLVCIYFDERWKLFTTLIVVSLSSSINDYRPTNDDSDD